MEDVDIYGPLLNWKSKKARAYGKYFACEFDRHLQSLVQTAEFAGVKGVVFGRFDGNYGLDLPTVRRIVEGKKQLQNMPVAFNVDFGHVLPMITFPIGGTVRLNVSDEHVEITIVQH